MKLAVLLFAIALLVKPVVSVAQEQTCSSRDIMKLMIKKGVWQDPRKSKVCLDMSGMPNVRMYLEDGTYDVHGQRNANYKKQQDASVKSVYDLFEGAIPKEKRDNADFSIKTKGYADGVFGSSSFDTEITSQLMTDGKLDYALLEELIKNRNKDQAGFDSIVALVKKISGHSEFKKGVAGPTLAKLQESRPLISQLRNVFEAKSRGDEMCRGIFGSGEGASKCQVEAYISPKLDRGKNCIDGCCDGRRGAVVDISLPVFEGGSGGGKGHYHPPFHLASNSTQLAMQAEASLHVVNLAIEANTSLDKKIKEGDFLDPLLVDQDRTRFRKALEGMGCETNNVTVDSFRRIYWGYHLIKNELSHDVKSAIERGDLATMLKLASMSKLNNLDKSALTTIQTGGQQVKLNQVGLNCDASKEVAPFKKAKDIPAELKDCAITGSDVQWFKDNGIENLHALAAKALENKTTHIVAATQTATQYGNFWFYDETTQSSHYFSMDRKCAPIFAPGTFPSISSRGDWPKRTFDPTRDKYNEACFKSHHGTLPEPNRYVVSNFLNKFTPEGAGAGEGRPTDFLNCMPVDKAYDMMLSNGGAEAERTQKPFCEVAANQTELSIGMDPANFNEVTMLDGKKVKGHVCQYCESGTKYDPVSGMLKHQPRSRKWKRDDLGDVYEQWDATSDPSKNSNLSMGGSKRLLTYLIPNCGKSCEDACGCLKEGNVASLLRDAEVFDFYNQKIPKDIKVEKYKGDGEGSYACLFSPPVAATCMVSPDGSTEEGSTTVEEKSYECLVVEKLNGMPDAEGVATPTDSELDAMEASCSGAKNFPAAEATCEGQTNPLCYQKRKEVAEACFGGNAPARVNTGNVSEQ